jgi:hypothetical protein
MDSVATLQGVAAGSYAAVSLASAIIASPHLTFRGLHVYHGAIQHVRTTAGRLAAVEAGPASAAKSTLAALSAAGIDTHNMVVTGGGTGTFMCDLKAGTHTELQPGSYLFMDGDYSHNEEGTSLFAQSLYGARILIEMYTRGCHWFPRLLASSDHELCHTLLNGLWALDDAIGSHAYSLEALACVGPMTFLSSRVSTFLPVHTVNWVETLKVCAHHSRLSR